MWSGGVLESVLFKCTHHEPLLTLDQLNLDTFIWRAPHHRRLHVNGLKMPLANYSKHKTHVSPRRNPALHAAVIFNSYCNIWPTTRPENCTDTPGRFFFFCVDNFIKRTGEAARSCSLCCGRLSGKCKRMLQSQFGLADKGWDLAVDPLVHK